MPHPRQGWGIILSGNMAAARRRYFLNLTGKMANNTYPSDQSHSPSRTEQQNEKDFSFCCSVLEGEWLWSDG